MKKLYIITGAAGHLGSTVIGMLKGKDCEVRGLILPEEQAEDTENVTFYKGDVTKPDTLRPLFENRYGRETYVIHTAGIVDIQNAVSPLIYNVNVNGTKNILRLCREYGVSESALCKWVKQYATVQTDDGEVLTAKQVKELQKRNAQLEEENLILKKAIAIFTPHSGND